MRAPRPGVISFGPVTIATLLVLEALEWARAKLPVIPLPLWCPKCGAAHVDLGPWRTIRHRTHLCGCGHEWRPFPFATRGL